MPHIIPSKSISNKALFEIMTQVSETGNIPKYLLEPYWAKRCLEAQEDHYIRTQLESNTLDDNLSDEALFEIMTTVSKSGRYPSILFTPYWSQRCLQVNKKMMEETQ